MTPCNREPSATVEVPAVPRQGIRLSPVTRRLLNLLTPLSLLLFLAAVVLWVRSASRVEYAYVAVGTRAFGLSTYDGSLYGVYYSVSPGGTVAGGT